MKINQIAAILLLTISLCEAGWFRRRRRCSAVSCSWSGWSSWAQCSHSCGAEGQQTRVRQVARQAYCGGSVCSVDGGTETRRCNTFCMNAGHLTPHTCICNTAWNGPCCQWRALLAGRSDSSQPGDVKADDAEEVDAVGDVLVLSDVRDHVRDDAGPGDVRPRMMQP